MIWKNIKTTFFIYSPYECAAVEEYLEQMAEKGWLLLSIKSCHFKFTKIEPKKIKYSVDVLSKVSIWDHNDTDVTLEYREYCQTAGWTYVCQTGKIQIFYTETDKKIIPIHTDQTEKFKEVFKASIYDMGYQIFITLVIIFNLYTELFIGNADFLLSSNYIIMLTVAMFFIVLINIVKFISFFLWAIKAKLHLKENTFMPYNNYKQLKRKNILMKTYIGILILALLISSVFDSSASNQSNIFVVLIVFIIIITSVQMFIHKKTYSKSTNIAITIISGTLAIIFLVFTLIFGAVSGRITKIQQSGLPSEKINLTLVDFGYEENNTESPDIDFNESILAQNTDYSYDIKDKYLTYNILQSQYPFIIKFYETRLIARLRESHIDLMQYYSNLPSNIKIYSYRNKKSFILVSKDKVINITKGFNDVSEDEFFNIVYQKLI